MDVVVGLDSGTTATKAVAAAVTGQVRAVHSVGYPLRVPLPGWAELDPAELRSAAVATLTAVAAAVRVRGDRVIGVCLSAAMHGLVPLDHTGAPLGPLVTWADSRATAQARTLRAQAGGATAAALHRRTGTPVHPMSPLLKLMWFAHHDRDLLRRTPRWGGVKELLISALCDTGHVVDLSCASATGMFDIHTRGWDAEAMQLAGVRLDQLAEVVPTTRVLGPLRAQITHAAGLPRATPLVAGAADGVLANLGLGAVTGDVGAVSLGTSGAIRAVRSSPTVDAAGRLFCYALTEDRWVLGGAVNNAGSVVRWAGRAFTAPAAGGGAEAPTDTDPAADGPAAADGSADDDSADDAADANARDERLTVEAAQAPVGSGGLLCLPYLLGERAPWWQSGMSAAYLGLRRDHRRPHLVRAAIEGVCQQLALVRDALVASEVPLAEIRATGGAVASPLWVTTLASALDLPVRLADSPEGTGLGACLLGHHALGRLDNLDDAAGLVAVGEPVQPDPRAATLYRDTRPLVERSTRALAEVFPALRSLADQQAPDSAHRTRGPAGVPVAGAPTPGTAR